MSIFDEQTEQTHITIRAKIMHSTDHETGEVTSARQFQQPTEIDMETGESDSNIGTIPTMRKRSFVIPKKLFRTQKNSKRKLRCMDSLDNYTLFKKEEVMNLQEVIMYIQFTFSFSFSINAILVTLILCRKLYWDQM